MAYVELERLSTGATPVLHLSTCRPSADATQSPRRPEFKLRSTSCVANSEATASSWESWSCLALESNSKRFEPNATVALRSASDLRPECGHGQLERISMLLMKFVQPAGRGLDA